MENFLGSLGVCEHNFFVIIIDCYCISYNVGNPFRLTYCLLDFICLFVKFNKCHLAFSLSMLFSVGETRSLVVGLGECYKLGAIWSEEN